MSSPLNLPQNLPERIDAVLRGFLDAAQEAFGADLLSAVLFGSAAEGRMRATSDLNVILVLRQYLPDEAIRLAGQLSIAGIACGYVAVAFRTP
jgi:predicted nucleotidyltransferase